MATSSARELLRVAPRSRVELAGVDPSSTPGLDGKAGKAAKADALKAIARDRARLLDLQERLYAEGSRSLLLVLQGTDTSGKDGVVGHVITGVNPEGCRITCFKAPTPEERRHPYLWRIRRAMPVPGEIGIFNRSQYEDVLIVRVHDLVPPEAWSKRYDEINRFESRAVRAGTTIVKVFLHISYDEQRARLLARLDDPTKHWKFKEGDLDERARWSDYQMAYEALLSRCSTGDAPWYLVPANRRWYRNWAVGRILVETLHGMDPSYPQPDLDVARLKDRLAPPN